MYHVNEEVRYFDNQTERVHTTINLSKIMSNIVNFVDVTLWDKNCDYSFSVAISWFTYMQSLEII